MPHLCRTCATLVPHLCRTCAALATPSAEVQPQGEFGGKLPPVRTSQLNWGWPWPGRGLASCPQFGSFDGRSQGGFEKPALGCIFHRAGPGLPGDMRPGDDDKRNRPQGGFSKPALGCIFHKAGPGLPRGKLRMTTKNRPQGDSKKPAVGCLF